jgi:hypothetical protein
MPTTSSAPPDVHELVAAYRTLDLEPRASAVAIRIRYRELAQSHHPDKWPPGSAEQVAAAERMREINAAYDLIEDAPLQYREVPGEPTTEPVHEAPHEDPIFETRRSSSTRRSNWLTRVDRDLVVCIRFLYGLAAGGSLVYGLSRYGVMQNRLFSWLVPMVMGFVFARSSWVANRLLEAIVGWLRLL